MNVPELSYSTRSGRIGYVVKRYPRFSETFIVNEILAHEQAGLDIEIFSIRPCTDTHFQDRIARVRAPLTPIPSVSWKASVLWAELKAAQSRYPRLWQVLEREHFADELSVAQALLLADQATRRGITHLHAHFATLPTTVARLASAISGIPFSFTAHAKDIFHESVNSADLQEKLTDAAAVVTVSQFNVDYLTDQFDVPPNKVHCVYNGLDLGDLPFREPLATAPVVLAVGRLVEKKGFETLVQACALLRDAGRFFQCQIVGGGDQYDTLQRQIGLAGLHQLVALQGPRPSADVKRMIHDSSVLAAPCLVGPDGDRDGLPTVLLEAMALGTPCIATAVTGIPEVLRHEKTGLMVPQQNPAVLADAIARLLDDTALRIRLAHNARQLIEEQFDSRKTSFQLRTEVFSQPAVPRYRPVLDIAEVPT